MYNLFEIAKASFQPPINRLYIIHYLGLFSVTDYISSAAYLYYLLSLVLDYSIYLDNNCDIYNTFVCGNTT